MTLTEIVKLQETGIDWFGEPLKRDGTYGPKTKWWHGISQLSVERQEVIRLILGYHAIGAKEEPSIQNGGTFVDMLLKPAGLKNLPWCIALISHVYRKTGVTWPKYHTSAWQLITWAEQNDLCVDNPLPGDLCAFLYPKEPGQQWKGHGFTLLGMDDDWTYGCEGNVTNAVRVGKRARKHEMKFIRVLDTKCGKLYNPEKLMRLDNLGTR